MPFCVEILEITSIARSSLPSSYLREVNMPAPYQHDTYSVAYCLGDILSPHTSSIQLGQSRAEPLYVKFTIRVFQANNPLPTFLIVIGTISCLSRNLFFIPPKMKVCQLLNATF